MKYWRLGGRKGVCLETGFSCALLNCDSSGDHDVPGGNSLPIRPPMQRGRRPLVNELDALYVAFRYCTMYSRVYAPVLRARGCSRLGPVARQSIVPRMALS